MVDEPESNGRLWHFTADGRLTASSHPDEYLALEADLERYTLGAGDALTLSDEPGCPAKVRLTPEGTMTLAGLNASADCETFPKGTDWHFIRVSPLSVAGAALTEHPNAELPHAAAEPVFMHDVKGTWLLRGSGTLLVVSGTPQRTRASTWPTTTATVRTSRTSAALPPSGRTAGSCCTRPRREGRRATRSTSASSRLG